jgi:hypothetical protein
LSRRAPAFAVNPLSHLGPVLLLAGLAQIGYPMAGDSATQ